MVTARLRRLKMPRPDAYGKRATKSSNVAHCSHPIRGFE
jgi:hypothetical protein